MIQKIGKKNGFTLVEMLIAIAIFVSFTSVLIGAYAGIVRSQREANEYRIMYVEGRRVFESLVSELRDGMVDYSAYSGVPLANLDNLRLISKDGGVKTHVRHRDGFVEVARAPSSEYVSLNSDVVKVTDFRFYVSPAVDPYDPDNVGSDTAQFQPKVTVYAEFERELASGKSFTMNLQTTVSSRIYNQIHEN